MAVFNVVGGQNLGKDFEKFAKHVQRKVDLAAKTGKTKALELVMYGKTTNINPRKVSPTGALGIASKRLGIAPHHLYYRAFARGIKRSRPYASGLIRTNDMLAPILLLGVNKSKEYHGYTTRKRGTNSNKGKRQRIRTSRARAAKRSIQGSGRLKIGKRTYRDVFIQDGRKRNDPKVDAYYRKQLGADAFKLGKIGNPMMIMQKKHKTQDKPYPTKVVKIPSSRVYSAVMTGVRGSVSINNSKIKKAQHDEVNKRLKKLGLKLT